MRHDAHFSMLPALAFCPTGRRMTLEGGDSNSSSSTSTVNQDNRFVIGAPGVGVHSSTGTRINVKTLDQGAIKNAFHFGKNVNATNAKNLKLLVSSQNKTALKILGIADKALTNAFESVDATAAGLEKAYEDAKGAGTEKTMVTIAALTVVAVIAFKAWDK